MKKNKYRFFQILSGIVFVASIILSCENFLDEVPGDKIPPDQHYRTSIDATMSTIGAFSILQDVMPNLIIMNDLRSDLLTETENFDKDLRSINRHNIHVDNKYNDPSGYYRIILNANEVLNNLKNIRKYDREFDSLSLALYSIDMISLRTWAYFTLVKLYGEAAYIPQNINSFDKNYQFEYYSKDRMIDTLLNQLDTSLTYADDFIDEIGPLIIFDRALRGELYLEKQDYAKASFYLMNAIGGADVKRFKLNEFEDKDWKNIFSNSAGRYEEVMSAVLFAYEDNQENPLSDIFFADRKYLAKPTGYIVNLFSSQTTQEDEIGDTYRGLGISFDTVESKCVVKKYNINPNEFSGADVIIYRAADIQLLLAEALNQMGDFEAALSIINDGYTAPLGWKRNGGVRNRVLLTLRDMPAADVQIAIEDMIMEERAMELAFEGKRWFDLVRVAKRRGAAYLADKVASKYDDPALANEVRNKLMDPENWYLQHRK